MPHEPLHRSDLFLYRAPARCEQMRVFQSRLFDRAKLHRNVKPVENPTERVSRTFHGFLKLARAVGQNRHAFV